jgi:hypothetical protein
MTDAARDLDNLTDFLMRARHEALVMVARALARELLLRGLPGDDVCWDLARKLDGCRSAPRAEPLARPT